MADKWIVLKPSAPMQLANATLRIKQGQVVLHPPYNVAETVFDIFDNFDKAVKAAEKNLRLKEQATRHGVTDTETLAKLQAAEDLSPAERRKRARESAKILTPEGLTSPEEDSTVAELRAEKERLEVELEALKNKEVNPEAYLDQNSRTTVKNIRKAAKQGKLRKTDVEKIIASEKGGRKRKTVLDRLKYLVKDDIIFGKLFK